MEELSDLERQLVTELQRSLAGPIATLLGEDLAILVELRIVRRAKTLVLALRTPTDLWSAVRVASDLLEAIWGTGTPDGQWWHTPLGRTCAEVLGYHDDGSVTQVVAAEMLGVARGTVARLVQRGTLATHPRLGGVARASVFRRIARLG
ncbi:MAG: hypothetical protein ACRDYC_07625 [Acidimicrobiales bacterium]